MNKKLVYSIAKIIYTYLPRVYTLIYFYYKNISDGQRIRILKENIKPGDCVLDIGGNIGFYSILMAKLVGEAGEVHVFEPDPLNFKYLERNINKYKNVKTYNLAAGAVDSIIKLYCSDELNVDHQTYDSGENRKTIDVKCVSLDSFFNPIKKINFVKIDVQGFDSYVIEGMKNIIINSNDIKVLGEFWPYGLNKAGSGINQYIDLIRSLKLSVEFFDKTKDTNFENFINNKDFYTDFWAYKIPVKE